MINRFSLFSRWASGLAMACLPLLVAAAPSNPLEQFVAEVQSARGQFVQARVGEGAAQAAPQRGVFSFQRPGRFRWEVIQPFEQLVLSDGQLLYQYDPDLAQVIEREVDDSIGASPAAVLFGVGELGEAFAQHSLPEADGLVWLRLLPHRPDAGFVHVDIGFEGKLPVRLLLLDSFGQTSRIDLSGIEVNPAFSDQEFQFQPPEGTDVVRM